MTQEYDRLLDTLRGYKGDGLMDTLEAAFDAANLIESLAKDAARYRLLRSFRPGLWLDALTEAPIPNEHYARQLDAAIDAAIASQAPHLSRES